MSRIRWDNDYEPVRMPHVPPKPRSAQMTMTPTDVRTVTLPAAHEGETCAVSNGEEQIVNVKSPRGRHLATLCRGHEATFEVRRFLWWRWWVRV